MSDLISRSKIRDYIKTQINPYGKPFEGTAYELGLKIMRYIDAMDSVYDIDKVVEELESFAKLAEDRWTNGTSKHAYQEYKCWVKAIEIVKQGGVSDDVCEWESIRDGEFIQNPHTRRTFSNEPSMKNVYCNTCGKKIKIVGDLYGMV